MNLAASNIAWEGAFDEQMYRCLADKGFHGLEIAPTHIFPDKPYEHIDEIKQYAGKLKKQYGLTICSMQSILYGKNERIFGSKEEFGNLLKYLKKAVCFAEVAGCKNLVFGCPRNRFIPQDADESIAIELFRTIGDYAYEHKTTISIEPNPVVYNTNYINTTEQAIELVDKVNSKGFKINIDVGTIIENSEKINLLSGVVSKINHVHISEPNLVPLVKRGIHNDLIKLLVSEAYDKYISIEMKKSETVSEIIESIDYVKELVLEVEWSNITNKV